MHPFIDALALFSATLMVLQSTASVCMCMC